MKKLNYRGVTMIEVLAAIVIIGIVTAGMLTIAVSSTESALKTSQKENAVCNAQNIAELWQWHKRYYEPETAGTKPFQYFSITLAEKLYNLAYIDLDYDDPNVYIEQLKRDDSTIYQYTLYMDSDWNQMTIYDGEQGLATYRIEITQGSIFAGENDTAITGIESIIIRVYVEATGELIVEY